MGVGGCSLFYEKGEEEELSVCLSEHLALLSNGILGGRSNLNVRVLSENTFLLPNLNCMHFTAPSFQPTQQDSTLTFLQMPASLSSPPTSPPSSLTTPPLPPTSITIRNQYLTGILTKPPLTHNIAVIRLRPNLHPLTVSHSERALPNSFPPLVLENKPTAWRIGHSCREEVETYTAAVFLGCCLAHLPNETGVVLIEVLSYVVCIGEPS